MGRFKRVLFVIIASALPAMIACNAIVGIDDFRKGECETVPCAPPDGGPDNIVPDNIVPDSRPDTAPDAPPGVGPVSWAQFPMPNYKIGVDASAPRPLDYQVNTSDEVTDKVTGRVWRRAVIGNLPGEDLTPEQGIEKCKLIPFGPWRLPKRIELVTLLSHGGAKPFIDTSIFTGVPADVVWTSSEVRPFNGKYWAVDFNTGALVQLEPKLPEFAKVLCVKDGP